MALRSRELPWRRCRPAQLLIVAAIFHLVLTITVFSLGRLHVLPRTFDEGGIAISFAPDSAVFRDGAAGLSPILRRGEILHWLIARQPFHVKLYSICFTVLGGVLGENIVTVEPLNLFYYLTILVLVFTLAREIFDETLGLVVAALVAVWPSLL